jgi:hypothetical protein
MLFGGAWADAVAEVQRACDRLARPTSQPALGVAHYVRAELHRLRGEFAEAEVAYRKANQWGRQPQPGLAQLRLAQGGVDEAHATMRRVLNEAEDVVTRSRMLGAYVEIALGGGDVAAARGAAEELSGSRPCGVRHFCRLCRRMRPGRSCWPRATPGPGSRRSVARGRVGAS